MRPNSKYHFIKSNNMETQDVMILFASVISIILSHLFLLNEHREMNEKLNEILKQLKEREGGYLKLKSKELETDLQNFVGEYSFNIDSELFHTLSEEQQSLWKNDIENALVNGVQWQKGKMIKDAVEVEYWDGNLFCNELREKYKDGDIVKIIIIEEN